jgi:V-type H+-transporting ATPase subunit H
MKLRSFEKYQKEIESQSLEWGPIHSEKFWKENYKRFEDKDFFTIK